MIPTRNRANSVVRAVRSVLAQTVAPVEVVVVDDGSDRPVALPVDLARGSCIRVVRTDGVGPAAARNLGVSQTSAPLIAFLDDDDSWRPSKLARQVEVMQSSDAEVAAIECGFDLWEDGRHVMRYLPSPHADRYRTLLERPALQPSTVLLRRAAFDDLGGFNPRLRRTEDWDLWLRLAERYRIEVLQEVHVDREHAHVAPAVMLESYEGAVRLLAHRLTTLPIGDRRRIGATHAFEVGILSLDTGDVTRARRELLRAWRANPRWPRPLAHLVRAVVGERAWRPLRRAGVGLLTAGLVVARRDPRVRRW